MFALIFDSLIVPILSRMAEHCDPVVPDPQRAALHSFPRWHTADLGHPGDLQEKQTALEEGEVCAGQELPEGESVSSLQQQSWLHGAAGEWGTRGC